MTRRDDRWAVNLMYPPDRRLSAEEASAERCAELVRRLVGAADLQVEVLPVLPWTTAAQNAERYRPAAPSSPAMPPTCSLRWAARA